MIAYGKGVAGQVVIMGPIGNVNVEQKLAPREMIVGHHKYLSPTQGRQNGKL